MIKGLGCLSILFLIFCFFLGISNNGGAAILCFLSTVICVIAIVAILIYRTVRFTVDAASATIDFIGDAIEAVITGVIDLFSVKETVKQQVPEAFKILIQEKRKTAIDVGIFAENGTPLKQMVLNSDYGVSEDLEVGQTYIL